MKVNTTLSLQKVLVVLFVIIIGIVFQSKAFGQQLAPIINKYGIKGMGYGDGRHPGIDYLTTLGTPIVAVSDGIILFTGEPHKDKWYGGGFAVKIAVDKKTVTDLIPRLKKMGVRDILQFKLDKVIE